ncbi:MarC family protein [Boudabousia marimammalium]|uniref:MarC family protein n=1 Tax=Boudabousia marimammalium TaxID=156892 RepID=UPI000ADB735F|nr:MarC family protein [Boudabousia marimammalium]
MNTVLFIKALGTLFAIMNPFVNLPVFLSLTGHQSPEERKHSAIRVILFSSIMSLIVFFSGQAILSFFSISMADFRTAGGLVLLTISLGMLGGKGSSSHEGSRAEKNRQEQVDDIAFYPFTFPIVVGPGTITALILFGAQSKSVADYVGSLSALALVLVTLAVVLYLSNVIGKRMSFTLRTIMTRLMGMTLAAISVQMMASGLVVLLPGLAG